MNQAPRASGSNPAATPSTEPTGKERLRAIWPSIRPDLTLYSVAIAAAPLTAGLAIFQPWLQKVAVDRGINGRDGDLLAELAFVYLGSAAAAFASESVYTMGMSLAASRSITRLREQVYVHALSLSQSFHDREPTGRLLTRVTSDVEALGETLTAGAVTIVVDVLTVLGVLGAMLYQDAWLTAVLLLIVPPLGLAIEFIRRKMRVVFTQVRTTLAELIAYTAERFAGIEVVQLYSDEARALSGFDLRLRPYREANVVSNVWDALMFALVDAVTSVSMALMLAYGASNFLSDWTGAHGAVTAGLLAAFIDYVQRMFTPIRELSNKLAILQRAATSVDKLGGLLLLDQRVADGTRELPPITGDVVLQDATFAYGNGPQVLGGISLAIRPGEVVALVGRTGSGKTTIGKVLLRMYDGYGGSIRVDGIELSDVRLDSLRKRVSCVQQDVVLFPADVRFNLTLGEPISDERLEQALDLAQARPVIERLGGLDGRIEAHGRNLSVGEAQLLAFARVMARDTPLVILDEATASVDSLTEARIQEATRALLERRTVLVVAHRLSTVTNADRIVVLDGGRVLESGSHAELLARNGAYASLFRSQYEHAAAS